MYKAAIYTRVSTVMQADKYSLPMQREDLISYCKLILHTDSYEVFEDAGFSGKNTDRPALQEMLSKIRQGGYTHLLVWKLDRISRNLLDFVQLYEELKSLGVTFVSRQESFDTSTAMGEAMLKIILIFAELERKMTVERVTATMISRATTGVWNGGAVPFGYSYDKASNTFSVVPEDAKICRFILETYLVTSSITDTLRALAAAGYKTVKGREWSSTAVRNVLTNPFYVGTYRYNLRRRDAKKTIIKPEVEWIFVEDHHPAIFSLEESAKVKALLEDAQKNRVTLGRGMRAGKHAYPFHEIMFCALCGAKMYCSHGNKHALYTPTTYFCPNARNHTCPNKATSDTIVGKVVLGLIGNILRAQPRMEDFPTPAALEEFLLSGRALSKVSGIHPDDLETLFVFLESAPDDPLRPRAPVPAPPDQADLEGVRREIERTRRALQRLQDLYLFEDSPIPQQEYILKRQELEDRIAALEKVAAQSPPEESSEDFFYMAGHLLLSSYLLEGDLDYPQLLATVPAEVLQEYLSALLTSVHLDRGTVTKIVFRNGLSLRLLSNKK